MCLTHGISRLGDLRFGGRLCRLLFQLLEHLGRRLFGGLGQGLARIIQADLDQLALGILVFEGASRHGAGIGGVGRGLTVGGKLVAQGLAEGCQRLLSGRGDRLGGGNDFRDRLVGTAFGSHGFNRSLSLHGGYLNRGSLAEDGIRRDIRGNINLRIRLLHRRTLIIREGGNRSR